MDVRSAHLPRRVVAPAYRPRSAVLATACLKLLPVMHASMSPSRVPHRWILRVRCLPVCGMRFCIAWYHVTFALLREDCYKVASESIFQRLRILLIFFLQMRSRRSDGPRVIFLYLIDQETKPWGTGFTVVIRARPHISIPNFHSGTKELV